MTPKLSNKRIVRARYPQAYLGGYFGNYFIYTSYSGNKLGRGRLQREAWASAAENVIEECRRAA